MEIQLQKKPFVLFFLVIFFFQPVGCQRFSRQERWMKPQAPLAIRKETDSLSKKARLTAEKLGISSTLFWCFYAQDQLIPRFQHDSSKTIPSLIFNEIQNNPNFYDPRTSLFLETLQREVGYSELGLEEEWNDPELFKLLYFNHRYQQIRISVENQKIIYDPELLWLYALLGYEYGHRAVLFLLNDGLLELPSKQQAHFLMDLDPALDLLRHPSALSFFLQPPFFSKQKKGWLKRIQFFASCIFSPEVFPQSYLKFFPSVENKGAKE